MNNENKILLVIQIIVTIIVIIMLINQPEKHIFTSSNSGQSTDVLESSNNDQSSDIFSIIIFFAFVLWLFGAVWGAGLFVTLIIGYTILKALFNLITKKEKEIENEMSDYWGRQMLYSLILGYISSFIVLIAKI